MRKTETQRGRARLTAMAGLAALFLLTGGCGPMPWDHTHADRLDRITPAAGDAQARNMIIQSADPIPADRAAALPTYDGRRVLGVIEGYRGAGGGGTEAAAGGAGAGTGTGTGGAP